MKQAPSEFVRRRLLPGVAVLVVHPALAWGQAFSNAVSLGTVDIGELREASGIAASRQNDAVLWTHNDAGGGPRLFALDTLGRHLGSYDLPNSPKSITKTSRSDQAR